MLEISPTHRPDFELSSAVGFEEHCLRSERAARPLHGVAVERARLEVAAAAGGGHVGADVAVALDPPSSAPVSNSLPERWF